MTNLCSSFGEIHDELEVPNRSVDAIESTLFSIKRILSLKISLLRYFCCLLRNQLSRLSVKSTIETYSQDFSQAELDIELHPMTFTAVTAANKRQKEKFTHWRAIRTLLAALCRSLS